MTSRHAVVYGVGGLLLAACLAAANMPQDREAAGGRAIQPPRAPGADLAAIEIRAQAARLHTLMAQAPVPGVNPRNPFSFAARPLPVSPRSVRAAIADDAPGPVPPPLPPLTLMGVVEETTAAGPRRTAIIGGANDEIYMAAVGDAVGERYRVTKLGADAAELEDVVTKAYRRLGLR